MSVYFAQAGDYIKIGYSHDPIGRAATITRLGRRPVDLPRGADATLLGWVPGDRELEARFHRRFAADRVAGEWFHLDPDVARDLIWSDPCGVDLHRMSAVAVFACAKYPSLTRDEIEAAGIRIHAASLDEWLAIGTRRPRARTG